MGSVLERTPCSTATPCGGSTALRFPSGQSDPSPTCPSARSTRTPCPDPELSSPGPRQVVPFCAPGTTPGRRRRGSRPRCMRRVFARASPSLLEIGTDITIAPVLSWATAAIGVHTGNSRDVGSGPDTGGRGVPVSGNCRDWDCGVATGTGLAWTRVHGDSTLAPGARLGAYGAR